MNLQADLRIHLATHHKSTCKFWFCKLASTCIDLRVCLARAFMFYNIANWLLHIKSGQQTFCAIFHLSHRTSVRGMLLVHTTTLTCPFLSNSKILVTLFKYTLLSKLPWLKYLLVQTYKWWDIFLFSKQGICLSWTFGWWKFPALQKHLNPTFWQTCGPTGVHDHRCIFSWWALHSLSVCCHANEEKKTRHYTKLETIISLRM